MHNIGTVPTFKMHNVGTVPMFKMHNVGTPKIYDLYFELEFGLYGKNKSLLIASVFYLTNFLGLLSPSKKKCPKKWKNFILLFTPPPRTHTHTHSEL